MASRGFFETSGWCRPQRCLRHDHAERLKEAADVCPAVEACLTGRQATMINRSSCGWVHKKIRHVCYAADFLVCIILFTFSYPFYPIYPFYSFLPIYLLYPSLHINLGILRMAFDELAAGRHFIAHEHTKHLIGRGKAFDSNHFKSAGGGVHGGIP
jgi:hypothetical protein